MATKQEKPAVERAMKAVETILNTLESSHDWNADTLDAIVRALTQNGFKPRI